MARASGYTKNSWFQFSSQQSEKLHLKKDEAVYYEAFLADNGGDYEFMLGLKTDDTRYTSSEVQGAIDEVQQITVSSVYLPDIQVSDVFFITKSVLFCLFL